MCIALLDISLRDFYVTILIIGLTQHKKEVHLKPKPKLSANLSHLEPIETQGPTETKLFIQNEIDIDFHEVQGKSLNLLNNLTI